MIRRIVKKKSKIDWDLIKDCFKEITRSRERMSHIAEFRDIHPVPQSPNHTGAELLLSMIEFVQF